MKWFEILKEEPEWMKRLKANRKKAAQQRGGRGKGGAGRKAASGRRGKDFRKCDRCNKWIGPDSKKYSLGESVYCEKCARERGLA
mgnify:CR=1 FL=1